MNNKITSFNYTVLIIFITLSIVTFFTYTNYRESKKGTTSTTATTTTTAPTSYKDVEYFINGENVKLTDGISKVKTTDDSATFITTSFFGNELIKDLNADGKEDIVFLLTQNTGGSGTFYYVVAALATENGYTGSQALLLGDRIAPQTTESGPRNSIIVNYADRNPSDSYTVSPSVGKSIRLILDSGTMQFGEVVQNFEGESNR